MGGMPPASARCRRRRLGHRWRRALPPCRPPAAGGDRSMRCRRCGRGLQARRGTAGAAGAAARHADVGRGAASWLRDSRRLRPSVLRRCGFATCDLECLESQICDLRRNLLRLHRLHAARFAAICACRSASLCRAAARRRRRACGGAGGRRPRRRLSASASSASSSLPPMPACCIRSTMPPGFLLLSIASSAAILPACEVASRGCRPAAACRTSCRSGFPSRCGSSCSRGSGSGWPGVTT